MGFIEQLTISWRSALLFGLFMPLIFVQLNLLFRQVEQIANRCLVAFLFIFSLNLVPQIIGFAGAYQIWPNLTFAPFSNELLLGPLLLAHIHFLTRNIALGKHWLWFIPGATQFIYYSVVFIIFEDYRDKLAFNDTYHEPFIVPIETLASVVVTLACLFLCWHKIKLYQRLLIDNYSSINEFEPVWLKRFLQAVCALALIWLNFEIADQIFSLSYVQQYPLYIMLTLIMIWFGYNAISRINLEYPKFSGSLHGNDLEGEDKSGINWRTLGQSYAQRLQQEKWYLDSKLSLPQMAAKLATNDNYLSKAINTGLGKNFNRLINEVRTEHAKSLMRENQKTALLNIAYDSGFSSKASFNRAFREITGQTPSQFRSQIVNS